MKKCDKQGLAAGVNVHNLSSCTVLCPISPALIHIEVNSSARLHGSLIKALHLCTFTKKVMIITSGGQPWVTKMSPSNNYIYSFLTLSCWKQFLGMPHMTCLDFLTNITERSVLKSHLFLRESVREVVIVWKLC